MNDLNSGKNVGSKGSQEAAVKLVKGIAASAAWLKIRGKRS